ncbi:MAG: hypothetical protein ACOC4Y_01250 [bacterium]
MNFVLITPLRLKSHLDIINAKLIIKENLHAIAGTTHNVFPFIFINPSEWKSLNKQQNHELEYILSKYYYTIKDPILWQRYHIDIFAMVHRIKAIYPWEAKFVVTWEVLLTQNFFSKMYDYTIPGYNAWCVKHPINRDNKKRKATLSTQQFRMGFYNTNITFDNKYIADLPKGNIYSDNLFPLLKWFYKDLFCMHPKRPICFGLKR